MFKSHVRTCQNTHSHTLEYYLRLCTTNVSVIITLYGRMLHFTNAAIVRQFLEVPVKEIKARKEQRKGRRRMEIETPKIIPRPISTGLLRQVW